MIVTNQAKDHLVMAVEAHVAMVEDKPDWKSLRECSQVREGRPKTDRPTNKSVKIAPEIAPKVSLSMENQNGKNSIWKMKHFYILMKSTQNSNEHNF